jgi:DNA-binding GntR family transcriptional regulator
VPPLSPTRRPAGSAPARLGATRRPVGAATAVDQCVAALRSAILRGSLLPGAHIRQEALADQLGVSRIPVREALKILQAEGVVTHSPNVGFTVARFDAEHLNEIYIMRTCLEHELLTSVRLPVPAATLHALRLENARFEAAASSGDTHSMLVVNRRFHFQVFELSPRSLIRAEVAKLWDKSEFYRSLRAYSAGYHGLVDEHTVMIDALTRGDVETLVSTMNKHRDDSRHRVVQLIKQLTPAPGEI